MTTAAATHGEHLGVPERVILAPAVGVFRPIDGDADPEGDVVTGQVVGHIEASGRTLPVRSLFTGRLVGLMAHAGERVRENQPVAWLRVQ